MCAAPHFEVVDALDGFARLVERGPTLDGSVPLRVAQGCAPLLEGNALGLQVSLRLAWRLRRSLAGWRVSPVPAQETVAGWGLPGPESSTHAAHRSLEALSRARIATLVARGWLPSRGEWHRALEGVVTVASSRRVRVFTGLLVRPAEGCVLRLARCANRCSSAYDVVETFFADPTRYVPLVVECALSPDARDVLIEGEIATLSVLPRRCPIDDVALEERVEVGRAHLDFYDRHYFDQKRAGEVTRKYRRLVDGAATAPPQGLPDRTVVVRAGPGSFATERSTRIATPDGVSDELSPCSEIAFANEVAFTARWDGVRVSLTWDRAALDARARAIAARWRALYPELSGSEGEGALWYLTKYFTPHPPGEPHFFTKPCAFTVTPEGWSSLVEGVPGDGYDVMRGVVRTDRFHATPAVFAFRAPGEVSVPAGRTLVRVMPLPREMTTPRFALRHFEEALPP